MYMIFLVPLALAWTSVFSLESPCVRNNVTIVSGTTFKHLVDPFNCGRVSINESEFRSQPDVILKNAGSYPLQDSLLANKSRTEFFTYKPLEAHDVTSEYWLIVFKQNIANGPLPYGITGDDPINFWPQNWIKKNDKYISDPIGGAVFKVFPARNQTHSPPGNTLHLWNLPNSNNFWRNGSYPPRGNYSNGTYPRPGAASSTFAVLPLVAALTFGIIIFN